MISGAHAVIFTEDAERLRAFLRDVLGFASVDAGCRPQSWLPILPTRAGATSST